MEAIHIHIHESRMFLSRVEVKGLIIFFFFKDSLSFLRLQDKWNVQLDDVLQLHSYNHFNFSTTCLSFKSNCLSFHP